MAPPCQGSLNLAGRQEREKAEYAIYPKDLPSPYRDSRFKVGEDMYALLGIGRDNKPARLAHFGTELFFFDAPAGFFCFVDRQNGAPSVVRFRDVPANLYAFSRRIRACPLAPKKHGRIAPFRWPNSSALTRNLCCSAVWLLAIGTTVSRLTNLLPIARHLIPGQNFSNSGSPDYVNRRAPALQICGSDWLTE